MKFKKILESDIYETLKIKHAGQTHEYVPYRFSGDRDIPTYVGKDGILGKDEKNIPWDEILRLYKKFGK